MMRRFLVVLLIVSVSSPAFAGDLQQTITRQAILLAQSSATQTPAPTPTIGAAAPTSSKKESKVLMGTGIGMVAVGAVLVAYGSGKFGLCSAASGAQATNLVYSGANACYSDKVTGWMLGVGVGSLLTLGGLLTRK